MKILKKQLCIILAAIMLLGCMSTAVTAVEKDDYDHLPQVYVTGFASANIYYENDPEKKPLFFPFDTDRILGNIWNIDNYLVDSIKQGNANLLSHCVYSFLWDTFGMLGFDPDGTMRDGVTIEETVLTYDGDGKYTFYYDSRLSPVTVAYQLRDYIELVKADSGSDKIELVGSSYGAAVVTAYLNEFENNLDDLDSVVLCVPSVNGVGFIGELINGELNVDPAALKDFVYDSIGMKQTGNFLGLLEQAGILEPLLDAMFVPVLRYAIFDAIQKIGRDLLATIPAIWVCVEDEYYESAKANMYGENYDSPDHPYAWIISEMDYYHYNIMLRSEEILLKAKDKVKLSVICKYGTPAIPLSKNGDKMEDGFATLEVSSFGATCARYGEQLPADYVQAKHNDYSFLSPDGTVDASTCLLPFNTWVIKGLGHSQKNEDYWKLIDAIVYEDLDVFSSEKYPQFLEVSEDNAERLIPNQTPEKELGFFAKIIKRVSDFFTTVFEKIKSIFKF